MPRKKRKSLRKSSSVKRTSSVNLKQSKKNNDQKNNRTENDSIQDNEINMNEIFVPLSGREENNSKKTSATKSLENEERIGNQNILSADFIPFSASPLQRSVPKIGGEDENQTIEIEANETSEIEADQIIEISEVPVTIVVDDDDDDDAESICVDSNSNSDCESDSVNDSIQILGETENSCRKPSDQVSQNSLKRKCTLSESKKRKVDDSIEILEMIDSVSAHPGKKAKIDKRPKNDCTSLSIISNSDEETPKCLDQDDDIVIVETVDNNSRDSIKVMSDFIPLKMSSALVREKRRREKNFIKKNPDRRKNLAQKEHKITGVPHSLVFQDTVGIVPSSAHYKSPLSKNANQDLDTNDSYHNVYGNNMYNPNSVQKTGLRPVIIDGSNVAFGHGGKSFSTRGIEICVKYFVKRGHWVVAFVPLFRRSEVSDADRKILDDLKKNNQLAFTPSRFLHGRRVASYDDRFIVQCAAELGGVVVSTDNYRDLVCENEAWRETIEKRLLMFTWVGDLLMFPDDPNGRGGPRLEEFLRFPQ